MGFDELTYEEKVDTLGANYRMMQDTLANMQTTLKAMENFSKCASRLYSDADGFEGDIPEIKNHLVSLNGSVAKHEEVLHQHAVELAKLKTHTPYIQSSIDANKKYILTLQQWVIVIAVAVVGCGGGETLFDWAVKALGW